ncbi:hypothetical protein TWF694_011884 [Orbilia ellipsospora]|uniref:Uncharacterized protein n=1 Tax=Orbilia ellipsospora TaxID=2528407 RepID=A0AAV9X7T6_9PEZI
MTRRLSTRHQQNAKKLPEASKTKVAPPREDEESTIGVNTSTRPVALVGVKAFYTQEQRVKSFALSNARKRQSNSKKSKAQKWSWPTDHPAPELMARAGFYFKPALGDEDNVACFICQKNMSEWDQDDDPAEQHLRHNSSCGWALTMCRDLVLNGEIVCDPLGDEMCEARRMTFDDWWPHEGKEGWKPNIQSMVAAGFVFRPQKDGDDTVYCPYCKLSIDEWEQGDDPREAHKTLGSGNCLFLQYFPHQNSEEINQKSDVAPPELKGGKERTSKSRTSRARKPVANSLRKKQTSKPEKQAGSGELSNVVFETDEISDGVKPKKLTRGKKRQSSLMEDGGKRPLFPKDEMTLSDFEPQQINGTEHASQYQHSTKRRITRASMAKAQLRTDLARSSNHIASAVSKDESGLSDVRTLTVEHDNKGSTTLSWSTSIQLPKHNISDSREDFIEIGNNEVDQPLEKDLIRESALGCSDKTDTYPNSETMPNELDLQNTPLPEVEPIIQIVSLIELTTPLEDQHYEELGSPKRELPRAMPLPETSKNDNTGLREHTKSIGTANCLEQHTSDCTETINPKNKATVHQAGVDPIVLGGIPQKQPECLGVYIRDDALTTDIVSQSSPPEKSGYQSELPVQLAAILPPVSNSQDKDMKRKSDVVGDSELDCRGSKKRKMIRMAKSQGILPISKPNRHSASARVGDPSMCDTAVLTDNIFGKTIASGSLIATISSPMHGMPLATSTKTKPDEIEDQESYGSRRVRAGVASEKEFLGSIESAKAEGPSNETIGPVMSRILPQADNIDAIQNNDNRSQEVVSLTESSSGKPLPPPIDVNPSIPGSPSDFASQDSILNTQFSTSASQTTIVTSFHGSNKGVSFSDRAEEQFLIQPDPPSTLIQDPSVSVSPRDSRTPLSVVAKPQNGALALLTPRDKALGISFAPVHSSKPWKSSDLEPCIDGIKENMAMHSLTQGLSPSDRKLTVSGWVMEISKKAEKNLLLKSELLVRFFEDEAERAVAAIEAIETE